MTECLITDSLYFPQMKKKPNSIAIKALRLTIICLPTSFFTFYPKVTFKALGHCHPLPLSLLISAVD